MVQYIGIANDEPERVARHIVKPNILLPLVEAGWDEDMCGLWCKYNDMLSPTYSHSYRDGCWFCHNQGIDQLKYLYHNYPELWEKLLTLDTDSPVTFHADGHTVHDFDRRFKWEDEGYLPTGTSFRWDDTVNQQMNIYQFLEEGL